MSGSKLAVTALLFSAREFCRVLGIDRGATLSELVRRGDVHPVPWLNGTVRYSLEEAQRLAREGVRGGSELRRSRPRARSRFASSDVAAAIRAIEVKP